jgi:hypothetical protein
LGGGYNSNQSFPNLVRLHVYHALITLGVLQHHPQKPGNICKRMIQPIQDGFPSVLVTMQLKMGTASRKLMSFLAVKEPLQRSYATQDCHVLENGFNEMPPYHSIFLAIGKMHLHRINLKSRCFHRFSRQRLKLSVMRISEWVLVQENRDRCRMHLV